MKKALLLSLPVLAACVVVAVLFGSNQDSRRVFSSSKDCRAWASEQGLRVGDPGSEAFWISDRPDVDLRALIPSRIPAGCIIVIPAARLPDQYDAAGAVVWGEVAAWGCPELLAKLDEAR